MWHFGPIDVLWKLEKWKSGEMGASGLDCSRKLVFSGGYPAFLVWCNVFFCMFF